MKQAGYLGVDAGSISLNLVVVDRDGAVLHEAPYRRIEGDPVRAVRAGLRDVRDALPAEVEIAGAGVTGSGRHLMAAVIGADVVKNEISAHARAAIHLHPEVRTVFEIGGQDSKVTIIREGAVVDFAMNLVCAAGTGSFLDSQAKRLNLSIEAFAEMALRSRRPTAIAGRCTVFAESDMIHKQQIGHRQEDIVMGLCQAMVRNFLGNVCRGKDIRPPVLLQGGVSANPGIRRAFEEVLGYPVTVPERHLAMGAIGAAIFAARAGAERSRFRGCAIGDRPVSTRGFECEDCANRCEVVEIVDGEEIIGRTGGRCRKWEDTRGPREAGVLGKRSPSNVQRS